MKVWIDSLLFSCGSPLKKEYLNSVDPLLVIDFRENQKDKKWYNQERIILETKNVYQDSGKDKDKTIKNTCKKIVDLLTKKQSVLLVCHDGMTVCGYIAIICRWWYRLSVLNEKDFDYIKEVRDGNDFTSAKTKEQVAQMRVVKKDASAIMRWNNFTQ